MRRRIHAMPPATARRQDGVGMIELLVVMFITVVMMMGLFTVVYGTRNNYLAQNQLAQLQDSERLAMVLLTNSVQAAGYFPNPTAGTKASYLQGSASYTGGSTTATFGTGQGLYAVTDGSGNEQLFVRYAAGITSGGTNDGVADCTGTTYTGATYTVDVNFFYIANNTLYCQVVSNASDAAQPLVTGVTGMSVLYGVDLNGDLSADEYLPAASVTNWNSVVSVQITLTFASPFTTATAPGAGTPPAPTLTRTIDLLNLI